MLELLCDEVLQGRDGRGESEEVGTLNGSSTQTKPPTLHIACPSRTLLRNVKVEDRKLAVRLAARAWLFRLDSLLQEPVPEPNKPSNENAKSNKKAKGKAKAKAKK